jgi:hypothetical protein
VALISFKRRRRGATHNLRMLLFAAALALTIPFQFENNQIFVKVGINDAAPAWFLVDSGAGGSVIDTTTARQLGIKTEGEARGTGAGKGTYTVTFAKDVTYRLPGASFTVPSSYVVDFSAQREIVERDVAGLLAYDFFMHYVVDIDFDAEVMTLYDPATFDPRGRGTIVPFRFVKKVPWIKLRVTLPRRKAVETEAMVDSGSQDAVDVAAMAQSPHHLEVTGGVGLGEEFRVTLGRAESVQIGPYTMRGPIGGPGTTPLIGNEVLRRFHVIFDYPHQRLILAPNRHLHDAFDFDASGITVRRTRDLQDFVVHDAVAGSELKPGDVITHIDGQPSAAFTLQRFDRMMRRAGAEHRLTIRRGSATLDVTVRLERRL